MGIADIGTGLAGCLFLTASVFAEGPARMEMWTVTGGLRSLDQAFASLNGAAGEAVAFPGDDVSSGDLAKPDTLVRARFLLTPPADGDYRFAISGDDLVRLEMSEDGLPFKKRAIDTLDQYTGPFAWKSHPGQISEPVKLAKGQACYLEVQCLNQGSAGHFQLGWIPPGAAEVARLPLNDAALVAGYAAPAEDADDDALPDVWEREKGLPAGKNSREGGGGDPDGDGRSNRREYLEGTDPLKPEAVPAMVSTELWPGGSDTALDQMFHFGVHRQTRPAMTEGLASSVAAESFPSSGFQRTRGAIVPPASGWYVFHLAGQGLVSLDVSPDGEALRKRRVMRGGSLRQEFQRDHLPAGMFPSSGPVFLSQGQPCYFEITFYQRQGNYFLDFGWTRPDGVKEAVPMTAIQSHFPPFPDEDRDGLPDAWEREKGLAVDGAKPQHFATGDPDFDGADCGTEFLANSDPLKADSDGDGVDDGMELLLHSNPLDGKSPLRAPLEVDLFSATGLTPGWGRVAALDYESHEKIDPPLPDRNLPSLSHYRGCGTLEWKFNVAHAGFHAVQVPVHPVSYFNRFEIGNRTRFWIDGKRLPEVETFGAPMALHQARVVTPWLEAGDHVLRLQLRPSHVPAATRLFGLKISPVVPDAAGELKAHLGLLNQFTRGTRKSLTSPACVEFHSRVAEPLELTAGKTTHAMNPMALTGGWAEVDLPEDGSPVPLEVAAEGGGVLAKGEVAWEPVNVLALDRITLRAGDSLRLMVAPKEGAAAGHSVLEIDGETKDLAAGKTWVRKFSKAGELTVKGSLQTADGTVVQQGQLLVTVIAPPALPGPVVARVGSATEIDALPAGLEIDGLDAARIFAAESDGKLAIAPLAAGDQRLPVRLRGGGAIVGLFEVKAFHIGASDQPYFGGSSGNEPLGRMVHAIVENAPLDAVLHVACGDPASFVPFHGEPGKDQTVPLGGLGPDGLATFHVRALQSPHAWLDFETFLTLPDGSRR